MSGCNKFKPIPGFLRYLINANGDLILAVTKEKVNWHRSGGYICAKLINDDGVRATIGQHTALCLTFIPMPETDKRLITNHKNGNKSDNRLDNLEWVTYTGNILHAYRNYLRTDNVILEVVFKQTNRKQIFSSYSECCKKLNVYYVKLLKIIKGDFTDPDYSVRVIKKSEKIKKTLYPFGVCARNIATNELIVEETPAELSVHIGVQPKVITRALKKFTFQYPINGYDIRVFQKGMIFPKYSEAEINAFKGLKFIYQPVVVINDNGFRKLVGSVVEASKITTTDQRSIRFCLTNGTRCTNGFNYERFSKEHLVNK